MKIRKTLLTTALFLAGSTVALLADNSKAIEFYKTGRTEPAKAILLQNPDVQEVVQEAKPVIYQTVEQMPQFPGGDAELMKYISSNIKYPQDALENNIEGRVIVQFVVDKDGSISGVQVLRGLDRLCDQEAVRVVESMPQWIPGKHNGVAVAVYYRVPVTFKIMH